MNVLSWAAAVGGRKSSGQRNLNLPLLFLGLGLLAVIAVFVFVQMQNTTPFVFVAGEEGLVVLLRNQGEGVYTLRYTGQQPAELVNMQVMMAGEILHLDVEQVRLVSNDHDVILEQNRIPEGQVFTLQPNTTLDVRITFSGQTLGFNYLYGFRIGLQEGERQRTVEIIDPDFRYALIVE